MAGCLGIEASAISAPATIVKVEVQLLLYFLHVCIIHLAAFADSGHNFALSNISEKKIDTSLKVTNDTGIAFQLFCYLLPSLLCWICNHSRLWRKAILHRD